jgi:hypothetical protein
MRRNVLCHGAPQRIRANARGPEANLFEDARIV